MRALRLILPELTLAATLALAALGCGRTVHGLAGGGGLEGAEIRPLPNADAIYLTDGDIAIPYHPVAVITTDPFRQERIAREGSRALRAQAHRVGAHAVIHVQSLPQLTEVFTYRPGELSRLGTEWVTYQRLSGVAVVYQDPATEPWPAEFGINIPPSN